MRARKKEASRRVLRGGPIIVGVAVLVAMAVPAAAHDGPQVRLTEHTIVFRETVGSIAGTGPVCDSSGGCLLTAKGTGLRSTGDFVGTDGIALMSVRITPHGTVAAGLSTLVGQLAGCGTGTMTIGVRDVHDSTAPNGGSGRWRVMPGTATGDLVHLTGGGRTRFFPATDGGNGSTVLNGTITC